ncbi:MAG: HDIG domain-containing metalloprotein [Pseudomonadota bacterium]
MAVDFEKNVSRLFGDRFKSKKKVRSGLGQVKTPPQQHPYLIRSGLVFFLAVAAVFLAFPMPESFNLSLFVGDISDRNVKADRDLMVLDRAATEEKRDSAGRKTLNVFDLDDQASDRAAQTVGEFFQKGRKILDAAPVTAPIFERIEEVLEPDRFELNQLKRKFDAVFNFSTSDPTFDILRELEFSPLAEHAVLRLTTDLLDQGVVADKGILLEQPSAGIIVRRLQNRQEDRVPYAAVFPSLEGARRLVKERTILYRDDFSSSELKALTSIAQALLQPNLAFSEKETERRRKDAVEQVAPVYFQVKKGEMIIREGERVDELARQKLEALASKADRKDWFSRALGILVLTMLFLVVTCLVGGRVCRDSKAGRRDMVFLSVLLLLNMLLAFTANQVGEAMGQGWPGVHKSTIFYLAPLAASGMLAAIFLGALPGIFFSIIAAALAALIFDRSLSLFFYSFLGTIVGVSGVIQVRERGQVTKSALRVSLVNMGAALALETIAGTAFDKGPFFDILAALVSGTLSGVMVTGLVPLFEIVFGYVTNVKLLELANLDRPILRELMVQAPGTYHHSVIVGAMVEAAAEAIGANSLLAKVSAYYHDLGKMNKPLYFVENQVSGVNKHEKLAPSMSALILMSHVKDGVELARKHKLSPEIADIIRQHHGTSLISFFFQKAKNSRAEDQPEINIEDYRYPGPKPQTREAGLVMLADAVEAASRSVPDPNPARVQGMVQKIVNNIFSDGQLDECELTLKDLHEIARSFNKILTGIFHRRIAYPEPASKEGAPKVKALNGNQNKQPTKDSPGQARPDKSERKEDLKRLGMS